MPPWVAAVFGIVPGDSWPAVDERAVHDAARLWLAAAQHLDDLVVDLEAVGRRVLDAPGLHGATADAMRTAIDDLVGARSCCLRELSDCHRGIGRYLLSSAEAVERTKQATHLALLILLAQIAHLAALAPSSGEVSACGIPPLVTAGEQTGRALLTRLVTDVTTAGRSLAPASVLAIPVARSATVVQRDGEHAQAFWWELAGPVTATEPPTHRGFHHRPDDAAAPSAPGPLPFLPFPPFPALGAGPGAEAERRRPAPGPGPARTDAAPPGPRGDVRLGHRPSMPNRRRWLSFRAGGVVGRRPPEEKEPGPDQAPKPGPPG